MDALASAMLGATVVAAASVILNSFSTFFPDPVSNCTVDGIDGLTSNLFDMRECFRLELKLQAPAFMLNKKNKLHKKTFQMGPF